MDTLLHDISCASRLFAKSEFFAAVAVLRLAHGQAPESAPRCQQDSICKELRRYFMIKWAGSARMLFAATSGTPVAHERLFQNREVL